MRFQEPWRSLGVAVFLAFASTSALAAQPHLVADLNQAKGTSQLQPAPAGGVEQDGVLYFPAQDAQHGYELWRTDGTPDGTYRLVDLCPGTCWGGGSALGSFHGFVYFLGYDREHGIEIWRTDGTVGGEELLGDLCPGECGTVPSGWVEWRGALWFISQESGTSVLWTSDGTPEGTRAVLDLCADLGECSLDHDPSAFLAGPDPSGQGLVLWSYTDVLSLFRTDATPAGTVLLHRFAHSFLSAASGPQKPESLQTRVGRIAPAATQATQAAEGDVIEPLFFFDGPDLWTSDGTPEGTRFVRNVEGMVQYFYLASSRVIDGNFYAIFDFGEWLRSDGTAEGTIQLARVDSGFNPTVARIGSGVFAVTVNGIWRTGGTSETTVRFDGPIGDVLVVVEKPGRLFVMGYDRSGFVWTTDGTPSGTRRFHLAGPPTADQYQMGGFRDGVLISRGYRELWRIDLSGSRRLHDFQPPNGGSGPSDQIVLDDRLLFLALQGTSASLVSSDGTPAGTTAIKTALGSGSPDYDPQFSVLTRAGKRAFFNAGSRLWTTDGTPAGTLPFKPRNVYAQLQITAPIGFVGGRLVFGANFLPYPLRCDPGDTEPWVTDGTRRGTRQVVNLNPFVGYGGGSSQCETVELSSSPSRGAVLGQIALFAANDFRHGRELFATDGTKAGTHIVADLDPRLERNPVFDPHDPEFGPEQIGVGSSPSDLVRSGSRVFFVADDGTTGRELWVTDGTRRHTRRVADLVPGPGGSTPRDLVAAGGAVYFFAARGAGEGLYRSDGTQRGTTLVSDLAGGSQARELTITKNGSLFFVAFHPETGTELWTSRGTPGTTRRVADLRPGPRGSLPQRLKATGNRLVFAADDGTSGLEPWRSDGTPEGTVRLGDLAPGSAASSPGPFSVANGQVLFGADDGEHGRELWAIPLPKVSAIRPCRPARPRLPDLLGATCIR